jgi:hypothetical protein
MHYEVEHDPELDFNEQLRMEMGWGEVATGLNKVLFGYGTMFLGTTIGFGLVAIGLWGLGGVMPDEMGRRSVTANAPRPALSNLWALYGGLGILSVIGLISYAIILGGQFRCMLGAAERHGARWFMFLCIACVFLGPLFHFASGISSWQAVSELRNNPRAIESFQLNPMGQWLQLIGFVISMFYPLFFLLFLRAVACCLRVDWQVMVVNVFLVIASGVTAATCYTLYLYRPGTKPIPSSHVLLLALGWGAVVLLYVCLIALTRVTIHRVMSQVKSPLAT